MRFVKIKSKLISVLLGLLLISTISCMEKPSDDPDIIEKDENDLSYLKGSVIVCGDDKIYIVSYPVLSKDTIPEILWKWEAKFADDLPFEEHKRKFYSIDDCKCDFNKKEMLVSSSSGAIAIISIIDKKILFQADVPNAHSIEVLGNGKIAAAASTNPNGNKIMLFDRNSNSPFFEDSLYSAHGLVWDGFRNSLFALGYDVLREYELMDTGDLLKEINSWEIPGISGHDLQMGPDGSFLFLTEQTGAWKFSLKNHEFSKIDDFPDARNIKSINQNVEGQFIYTVPEDSWWTYHVLFFNPVRSLSFPDIRVYKTRLINDL